jgi:hypothetical protein
MSEPIYFEKEAIDLVDDLNDIRYTELEKESITETLIRSIARRVEEQTIQNVSRFQRRVWGAHAEKTPRLYAPPSGKGE